jgi:hypothetical protein
MFVICLSVLSLSWQVIACVIIEKNSNGKRSCFLLLADCSAALEAEKAKLTETMMASLSQVRAAMPSQAQDSSYAANEFGCPPMWLCICV